MNTSIKQEIVTNTPTKSKPAKEKNDDDDESSDDDKSVIILDSDTEAETEGEEGSGSDENVENEDEEESESNDDSSGEDEEEEEETETSGSDSDSVWSTVDDGVDNAMTSEAVEANIIKKFERSIFSIADKKIEHGRKILQKLLRTETLSVYQKDNVDFEEIEEPTILSKMLHVYTAIHKNLATIETDKMVEHYLQVLAYQPNNSQIWFEVAMKSVENGDLEFAKYAFSKCENINESIEAHATILYISCNYKSCLHILKKYHEDVGELNDKMKYLKYKIRNTGNYYKKMSDAIFEEDEVYTDIRQLDPRKIAVFDERISELNSKLKVRISENDEKLLNEEARPPMKLQIFADQDFTTVCTLFCDIFDRIQSYSKIYEQEVVFIEWENRKEFLDVKESLDEILDIVELVEEMTEQVEIEHKKRKRKSRNYLTTWKRRLFVDKPDESGIEEGHETAEEEEMTNDERTPSPKPVTSNINLPENELAETYGLGCSYIEPIRGKTRIKERTPEPSKKEEFIDEELVLSDVRTRIFSKKSVTISEILENTLIAISEMSPSQGALPHNLRTVIKELYSRLSFCENLELGKFEEINVMMMELGHVKAIDICIRKYFSFFGKEENDEEDSDSMDAPYSPPTMDSIRTTQEKKRHLMIRFMWTYNGPTILDHIKLDHLLFLKDILENEQDSLIRTTIGDFGYSDVVWVIDQLEKKNRIESVKQLWKQQHYKKLIEIVEQDIDFSAISIDETKYILNYWLQSYEKVKNWEKFGELATRAMHFYLFTEDVKDSETTVKELILKILNMNLKKADISTKSSIGYFLCVALTKYKNLETDWINWRCLYEIVKAMRDIPMVEYISTLDKNEDAHSMPSLDLDVLVKAHEVLGAAKKCSCQNYEFLMFIIDKCAEVIDQIDLLEAIFLKENAWIFANFVAEVGQCLHCLFGKYTKKRKSAEDHGSRGAMKTDFDIAKRVLYVVLIQPLPLYDDTDRLLLEVQDLLYGRFEFLIKVSDERQEIVTKFNKILQSCGPVSKIEVVESQIAELKTDEEELHGLIWYALALHNYRASSHEGAKKYSELFLTCSESSHDERLKASAWAILAREHVHELFQLDQNEIFAQWKWRIFPFKMAVKCNENEAGLHFESASAMYQMATSLTRFLRLLPYDDLRRKRIVDAKRLRNEARIHLDQCLALARHGEDGQVPEFQWLCYFFIGKLAAKEEIVNIVKVVESFYEAACGCQLSNFYYPVKIAPKKQANFEPIEVHYQVHAAVWKYLQEEDNPPMDVLLKLMSYLKVFANGHKVVKSSFSLFATPVEIYDVIMDLEQKVVENSLGEDSEQIVDEMLTKIEIIEKMEELCFKGFSIVCERFPHIKAHYRLAEYWIKKEKPENAKDHILRNVFRRKKKDDGVFDNVIEIASGDISRSGSLSFHVHRCLELGIILAANSNDLHNIVSIVVAMLTAISYEDDQFIELRSHAQIVRMLLSTLDHMCAALPSRSNRSTPSPQPPGAPAQTSSNNPKPLTNATIRNELWRLWIAIGKQEKKEGKKLIQLIENRTKMIIEKLYGSIETLKKKWTLAHQEAKKNTGVKRKANFSFDSAVQPFLKKPPTNVDSPQKHQQQPSTSRGTEDVVDDDVQCLDPPVNVPSTSKVQTSVNSDKPTNPLESVLKAIGQTEKFRQFAQIASSIPNPNKQQTDLIKAAFAQLLKQQQQQQQQKPPK